MLIEVWEGTALLREDHGLATCRAQPARLLKGSMVGDNSNEDILIMGEDLKARQRSSRMPLIPASVHSSHQLLLWPQGCRHNPHILHRV